MSLDKKTIETLSVNAVKNSVVTSEYLDQYIAENDKEPSWDGFVYIYGNKPKRKSNLKGRMPVQVKGKECDELSKNEISFSMSTADLRNYLYDGGCILFVVYIGNRGLTNKIYYVELTPIKLKQLLDEAKKQKSKTLCLKEFPCDNNKKATIFFNCLQNCQKQASFIEGKLFTFEELEKQGVLENIVIPFAGVGIKDPQMALVSNEFYIYARIKGSSILQPIEMVTQGACTRQVIDAPVKIDNTIFYTEYTVIKSAKEITLCFGESFKITVSNHSKQLEMHYKSSKKLRVLAKDLDFILSYIDKGYFNVNERIIPLDYEGTDLSNFNVEKEKERLKYIKDIIKVLDMLGCEDDIDTRDMNDEDWRNLCRLIIAFINKEPVKGLSENLPSVSCMKIGKLRFALYLKKCDESDGGIYEIYDFFKTELPMAFEDEKKQMLPVSQFNLLNTDDFLTLNNLNFDILLPSFQKAEHHSKTFDMANYFLLKLLNAYDKAEGDRKDKILKVCEDFSNWISEATDEELDYHIRTLNKLQTVKRIRDFNIDEISTLYEIVESSDTPEFCIVGAYLLLEQQQAAEIHFSRLSKEEQENFRDFPIYHYWKTERKKNSL